MLEIGIRLAQWISSLFLGTKKIAKLKKSPIEFQLFNGFYLSRQSRKKEKTSFDGSKPPTKKIGDKLTFHEEPSLNPQSCF